jgi:hypothetical protein
MRILLSSTNNYINYVNRQACSSFKINLYSDFLESAKVVSVRSITNSNCKIVELDMFGISTQLFYIFFLLFCPFNNNMPKKYEL